MKGVLVIIDGLGDLPNRQLNGKTPLEAANKSHLDYLASKGKLGEMYSINEKIIPESDTAILAILGNKILGSYRGQLEALGTNAGMRKGDLALRTNFATVDNMKNKRIIDRRAGRTLTTKEAKILSDTVNENVKLPCKYLFKNTIQHRGVLVLKGGFSDNITNTDPAYHSKKDSDKFKFSQPLDDDENSKFTANVVNEFIEESNKILEKHPINQKRKKKGLMPANILLTRDASTNFPDLKKFRKWASVSYMPLEIGISKASGMKVFDFEYPRMKSYDVYHNLYKGLKKAIKFSIKMIKRNYKDFSYFYIHFKETDVPGHDNKPNEKKAMIEFLDRKFFKFLRKFAEKRKIKVIVTGDHATPCKLKSHSADPIPLLLCDWQEDEEKVFGENQAKKGKLGKLYGKDVAELF